MTGELPALETCVSLYVDVWEWFGEDRFETRDLAVELHERKRDSPAFDGRGPDRYLELLVAYGLLDRVGDDAYRVRCTPDDTELEWQDSFADRGERLYSAVYSMRDERPATDSNDHLVTYRGRTYVSVPVDPDTEAGEVAGRVRVLHDDGELNGGIALRCRADEARNAQHVADALIDGEVRLPVALEKVNSEVTGIDSDDLEFRLFVGPDTPA